MITFKFVFQHAGLSHNACNTHIGDSTGNFMNHGYQQTTSTGKFFVLVLTSSCSAVVHVYCYLKSTLSFYTFVSGVTTSSTESFTSNNHPVSQANMDPMADFLGGHQNMNENDKIIKVSVMFEINIFIPLPV